MEHVLKRYFPFLGSLHYVLTPAPHKILRSLIGEVQLPPCFYNCEIVILCLSLLQIFLEFSFITYEQCKMLP